MKPRSDINQRNKVMATFGFHVELRAMPGKESEVDAFLEQGQVR